MRMSARWLATRFCKSLINVQPRLTERLHLRDNFYLLAELTLLRLISNLRYSKSNKLINVI